MTQDHTFLDDFDAEKILSEANATNSRQVKRSLIQRGLVYQISFWGAVTKISTDESEARRFEVFSATPYTEREVYLIKHVIAEIRPPYNYSLWEFDSKKKAMRVIAHYGKRTY